MNSFKCELIENIPHFTFNNLAYFSDDRDYFRIQYEKNKINFGNFCKYILSLKSISLEKTRKVMYLRGYIKKHIYNLASKIEFITKVVDSSLSIQKFISICQTELNYLDIRNKIILYKDNLNENNQKIYSYLLAGINCLYDLSKKNDELNRIALLFDYDYKKYEYTNRILKENMTEKMIFLLSLKIPYRILIIFVYLKRVKIRKLRVLLNYY